MGNLVTYLRNQWMGALALFLVVTGGTAYALEGSNTVFTDDIVNGEVKVADIGQAAVMTDEIANSQVKSADIGEGEVRSSDIPAGELTVDDLADNSVRADEIVNGQVKTGDIGAGEVRSGNVANDNLTGGDIAGNSLTGADIDEATLDVGQAATRLFAFVNGSTGNLDYGRGVIASEKVGTGVYTVTFNRSLEHCVAVGTPGTGNPIFAGDTTQPGSRLTVESRLDIPSKATVTTVSNEGAFADRSFHLAVFC